jgi:hypothetical protein
MPAALSFPEKESAGGLRPAAIDLRGLAAEREEF